MEEKSLHQDTQAGETRAPGCKDVSGMAALHASKGFQQSWALLKGLG